MSEVIKQATLSSKKISIKPPESTINKDHQLNDNRFAFLDILRFVASFIVAFSHLSTTYIAEKFPFFLEGTSGVLIFFLISGYIIPHAILRSRNIKNFLIKRCIRIFPLLIITAIYGLLRFSDGTIKIENILSIISGLLLPIADFIYAPYVARAVDWSLRLEFIFYILIAVIYFKNKFNFKTIIFCIILISISYISNYFYTTKYFNHRFILINFILLGSMLYLLEKENFGNYKNILFTIFAILFSINIFEICTINKFNFVRGAIFSSIFFLIFYTIHQTKFRIKLNKFFTFLGDISYPSYLLHQMIYKDLYALSNSHIATSIIFIAICFLVNVSIEKPIINWLKKYSN